MRGIVLGSWLPIIASWKYWWFPGGGEFLGMVAFMIWWGLAFLVALIPFAFAFLFFWMLILDDR